MPLPPLPFGRLRRRLIAGGAVVTLLLGLGAALPSPAAAAPRAGLEVRARSAIVTATNLFGSTLLDLGIDLVPTGQPFEIRAHRATYRQPIRAVRLLAGRDQRLPRWAVRDFAGFTDFSRLVITNGAGQTVVQESRAFCPNDYETAPVVTGALPTSPYPNQCPTHPYAMGAVWGIQTGWGADIAGAETRSDLAPGAYTATVTVSPRYQALLGMSAADATDTVALTVVDENGTAARKLAAPTAAVTDSRADADFVPPRNALPDLRVLPPYRVEVRFDRLLFITSTWNAGRGPVMIRGGRAAGPGNLDVTQDFYGPDGTLLGSRPAGTMTQGDDFSWAYPGDITYRLIDRSGAVVRSDENVCVNGNGIPVDLTRRGAPWQAAESFSGFCDPRSGHPLEARLDVGWGTVQSRSFELGDLPNGTYVLEVRADVEHHVRESNPLNNRAVRKVVISGPPGARTATAAPIGIVREP